MSGGWNKRHRLFVNRALQGRVIATVAWYWCIYHIALWHAMFLFYYLQYRRDLLAGGPIQTFNELYSNFAGAHIAVILCAAIVLPVVLWDVLKLSHRVVGPLVRFTSTLRQLTRGEPVSRIQLRRGDLLVGLQDAMNAFLASPHAPHRQPTNASLGSQHMNTEIEGILGDIREIQASLCRVYNPETDLLASTQTWLDDLHQPTAADPCDQTRLDCELALTANQDTRSNSARNITEVTAVSK